MTDAPVKPSMEEVSLGSEATLPVYPKSKAPDVHFVHSEHSTDCSDSLSMDVISMDSSSINQPLQGNNLILCCGCCSYQLKIALGFTSCYLNCITRTINP